MASLMRLVTLKIQISHKHHNSKFAVDTVLERCNEKHKSSIGLKSICSSNAVLLYITHCKGHCNVDVIIWSHWKDK